MKKAMKAADALTCTMVTVGTGWYVEYGKGQVPNIPASDERPGIILNGFPDEDAARNFVRKALNQGFTVREVGTLGDIEATKVDSASIKKWCQEV